jgi:DNA-binding NarL/FixJ family response regulator
MSDFVEVRIACSQPMARVLTGLLRRETGIRLTDAGGDVVILTAGDLNRGIATGDSTGVVLISSNDAAELRAACCRGIRVLCDGEFLAEDLRPALDRAAAGGCFVSESLLDPLFEAMAAQAGVDAAPPALSPREWQVARLIAEGHCDKQIARELGIRPATVRFHYTGACEKLHARNRVHLASRVTACLSEMIG